MGFVITPHHACCIAPVPGPPSFSRFSISSRFPPSPLPPPTHVSNSHHGASWAIMWSHYLTPCCSRVQLTKTARGPSCGKDSVGTQHIFCPRLLTFSLQLKHWGVSFFCSPVKGNAIACPDLCEIFLCLQLCVHDAWMLL